MYDSLNVVYERAWNMRWCISLQFHSLTTSRLQITLCFWATGVNWKHIYSRWGKRQCVLLQLNCINVNVVSVHCSSLSADVTVTLLLITALKAFYTETTTTLTKCSKLFCLMWFGINYMENKSIKIITHWVFECLFVVLHIQHIEPCIAI